FSDKSSVESESAYELPAIRRRKIVAENGSQTCFRFSRLPGHPSRVGNGSAVSFPLLPRKPHAIVPKPSDRVGPAGTHGARLGDAGAGVVHSVDQPEPVRPELHTHHLRRGRPATVSDRDELSRRRLSVAQHARTGALRRL